MKKNPKSHLRLKTVRKIIGDTQEAFARRIGVSYHYVLLVETGQREMNRRFADLVTFATGVSRDWLMDHSARPDKPVSCGGLRRHPRTGRFSLESAAPFTEEFFREWEERPRLPFEALDVDQERMIDDYAVAFASLLKAAARRGRFGVCAYYVNEMMEDTKKRLALKVDDDSDVPTWMFGEEFYSDCGEIAPSDVMTTYRMLSPAGKTKWANAMKGDEEKRKDLLRDLDETRSTVEASFSAKRSKRSSQRLERA